MIKTIQNWLNVRKQYKIEKKAIEMRDDAKKIIIGVMSELVKYDVKFHYNYRLHYPIYNDVLGITYGEKGLCLDLFIFPDKIKIEHGKNAIAHYETASWWQKVKHKRNLKKFIYTEDTVKAISNMIIMGEAV